MKDFFNKNFKRIWMSLLGGFGFGFVCQLIYSFFSELAINQILMGILIAGGAVGSWYILKNNEDFGR